MVTTPSEREVIEELARRAMLKAQLPDVLSAAFPKQRAFIEHPAKLKALFCTRRSAKSYTGGLYMTHKATHNAACNVLFVGLTRASAKGIIWKDILYEINRKFSLGAVANQADLTVTFPNRSMIYVTGIDVDEQEMLKWLGRKYALVVIDEASMYRINLANFVYGVLKPALVDPNSEGERGEVALLGTASDFPQGLFYRVTTGEEPGWQLFEWSAFDNPHVAAQWQEELDDIARHRPAYMLTPQYKQWYLNQWVIDETKLVYRFERSRNLVKDVPHLPTDGWARVLGIDLGWEDDTAFVLTAYHEADPRLYVLRCYRRKQMSFDEIVFKVNEWSRHPSWAPHRIIIDGANKQGVESMRMRSTIPFEYADKQDKTTFIELCNADLIQSKVLIVDIPENEPLCSEMARLVWDTDGEVIKLPKKEHPSLSNHLCDAFLYAWRMGFHYHAAPPTKKTVFGSRQWYQEQNDPVKIWEAERERLIAQEQGAVDDWGSGADETFGRLG